MLQAVSIKALSSAVRSSSALGLSACPRSRTQDAPPHTISILPHAERTRKYPHCIPLAAPRLGVLTLPSVTSSPPARSWRRPGRPTLPLSCCLLPCSQGVCTAATNRRRSLARRTSAAVDTGGDLLARPLYRTFSCLRDLHEPVTYARCYDRRKEGFRVILGCALGDSVKCTNRSTEVYKLRLHPCRLNNVLVCVGFLLVFSS
jgi:hypothetical protein